MKEIVVGDKVKFLNDIGTGVVTGYIDKEMVLVSTDDGFEYPVLKTELLVTGVDENEDLPDSKVNSEIEEEVDQISDSDKVEIYESIEPEKERITIKPKALSKGEEREKRRNEKQNSDLEEVDLHISEIIDDYFDLTPGEIVDIQLARFKTSLEGAIKAKQRKILFIHGKGAGKLKREIQKLIDTEYNKCRYQDASFREYGFGATMVFTA